MTKMSRLCALLLCGGMCAILLLPAGVDSEEDKVEKYTAQVRAYVDEAAVTRWKSFPGNKDVNKMKDEIRGLFVDVQDIYASLIPSHQLDIKFDLLSVEFMKKSIINYWEGRDDVLNKFQSWLISNKQGSHTYDIAIMFTGVHMAGSTQGVGRIATVCTDQSIGTVYWTGTYADVKVLAHEIGHIMGSEHDGAPNEGDPCYNKGGKIMNATTSEAGNPNQFYFSKCTGDAFLSKIYWLNKLSTNCMTDKGTPVSGPRFGHQLTADQMCQRKFGKNSQANLEIYQGNYDTSDFCVHLHCLVTGVSSTSNKYWNKTMRTPQGFPCGKSKECVSGKCVAAKDGGDPFVSDSCPLGDQRMYAWYEGWYTDLCRDVDLRRCDEFGTGCCHTCNINNRVLKMSADDVCSELYGKKAQLMRAAYQTYGDKFCSQFTCIWPNKGARGLSHKTRKAPDGLACGKNKRCYQGKCQKSRHGSPGNPDTCPYGDQNMAEMGYPDFCGRGECLRYKKYCCKSCKDTK